MDLSDFSNEANESKALRDLLLAFNDLFNGIGRVKGVRHRINLAPDAVPVALPTHRRSPAQEDAERAEVTKLLSNGVLEHSVSPWAAANVFVPEKSGGMRATTDFRKLNNMTVYDPMEDARAPFDWLGGRIPSTFDLKNSFLQVELAEASRPLTAARTVMGLVQYRQIPQGLKNSPATFQRVVTATLRDMKGLSVPAYMDDISVGTQTVGGHLVELRKVLNWVKDSGMKLKLANCHFGKRYVEIWVTLSPRWLSIIKRAFDALSP